MIRKNAQMIFTLTRTTIHLQIIVAHILFFHQVILSLFQSETNCVFIWHLLSDLIFYCQKNCNRRWVWVINCAFHSEIHRITCILVSYFQYEASIGQSFSCAWWWWRRKHFQIASFVTHQKKMYASDDIESWQWRSL